MEDLLQAMQVVDKNSDILPEGDYLQLCNHLKEAYNKKSKQLTFFNYDNFSLQIPTENVGIREYFTDHFFNKGIELDIDFIQGQIQYLEKEMSHYDQLRRITKYIKRVVRDHYCDIHDINQDNFNVLIKPSDFRRMCKSYLISENNFREKYREAILKKILWLEESIEYLESL